MSDRGGAGSAGQPPEELDQPRMRALLDQPAVRAAPSLLGMIIMTADGVALRLVEVEAYGADGAIRDPASHAYRGFSSRNASMFGPAGHLYVYRSFGIHLCANVVCGPEGTGAGILMRAAEVVRGLPLVHTRRGSAATGASPHRLASGPGRLGQALGLSMDDDGLDLLDPDSPITLHPGRAPLRILNGPRVGVTKAPDHPWRFWDADSPAVSRYRPGGRRTAR